MATYVIDQKHKFILPVTSGGHHAAHLYQRSSGMEIVEILLFSAMAQVIAEAIDVLWPETGGAWPRSAPERMAPSGTCETPLG
jgi:hypothetical protein